VKVTVLVRPKAGILDPQGEAVRDSLVKLGFPVVRAQVGRVIDLELEANSTDEAAAQVGRMCSELLANALIESYEIIVGEGS
jgi:phosphoribosylformylglycinamidine synthase